MAAHNDPHTITILVSPDIDWYQNSNPHTSPFPDTHVIAHFAADTITCEEPTIPPELNITRKKPSTLQIFCIHHQQNSIGTSAQMELIKDVANNLQILQSHTQIAPPTPLNITVNPSKRWAKSNYSNPFPHTNTPTPQLPNYQTNLPLKFHPQFSYYTDGSFIKPMEIACPWSMEKRKSWIRNP
jgi:hypothetical protein